MMLKENALEIAWLDRLLDLRSAYEAVRVANIHLRDAMEAAQLAQHDFFLTLVARNAGAVAECEVDHG